MFDLKLCFTKDKFKVKVHSLYETRIPRTISTHCVYTEDLVCFRARTTAAVQDESGLTRCNVLAMRCH